MTDVLAQLRACPALPRGERLAWVLSRRRSLPRAGIPVLGHRVINMCAMVVPPWRLVAVDEWRRLAAPLRRAREQRQAYRNALRNLVTEAAAVANCYEYSGDLEDELRAARAVLNGEKP